MFVGRKPISYTLKIKSVVRWYFETQDQLIVIKRIMFQESSKSESQ